MQGVIMTTVPNGMVNPRSSTPTQLQTTGMKNSKTVGTSNSQTAGGVTEAVKDSLLFGEFASGRESMQENNEMFSNIQKAMIAMESASNKLAALVGTDNRETLRTNTRLLSGIVGGLSGVKKVVIRGCGCKWECGFKKCKCYKKCKKCKKGGRCARGMINSEAMTNELNDVQSKWDQLLEDLSEKAIDLSVTALEKMESYKEDLENMRSSLFEQGVDALKNRPQSATSFENVNIAQFTPELKLLQKILKKVEQLSRTPRDKVGMKENNGKNNGKVIHDIW